jgi:hypothetical protein
MNEQTNHNYSSTIPIASGDKYWAQDMVRDHQYLRNVGGALFEQFLGNEDHVFEVDIIKGQDNQHVNINTASGLVKMQISVPDDSNGWAVPQEVRVENIYVLVKCPVTLGFALGTLAGTIRISYDEAIVANRTRAYTGGDYAYVLSDSVTIVANDSDPTEHELVVATYEQDPQDGLVITMAEPYRVKIYRLLNSIDARITNNETQLVLNLNTINSRLESNELTLTDHEDRIVAIESSVPDLPVVPPNEEGGAFVPRIVTVDVLGINQDQYGNLSSLISQSGSNVAYNQFSYSQFKLIAPNGFSRGVVNITASVQRNTDSVNVGTLWIMTNASDSLPSTYIARDLIPQNSTNALAPYVSLNASGSHAFTNLTTAFDQYRIYIDVNQNTIPNFWKGAKVTFVTHWFS